MQLPVSAPKDYSPKTRSFLLSSAISSGKTAFKTEAAKSRRSVRLSGHEARGRWPCVRLRREVRHGIAHRAVLCRARSRSAQRGAHPAQLRWPSRSPGRATTTAARSSPALAWTPARRPRSGRPSPKVARSDGDPRRWDRKVRAFARCCRVRIVATPAIRLRASTNADH